MRDYGAVPEVRWTQPAEASWIVDRLDAWDRMNVNTLVPQGLPAYVRLLHPGQGGDSPRSVRWSEMADWSGLELRSDSRPEHVAVPLDRRVGPRPWDCGPRAGSLDERDLEALIDILGQHTEADARCFFCIWSGYGWDRKVVLRSAGVENDGSGECLDDPIPPRRSGCAASATSEPGILHLQRPTTGRHSLVTPAS